MSRAARSVSASLANRALPRDTPSLNPTGTTADNNGPEPNTAGPLPTHADDHPTPLGHHRDPDSPPRRFDRRGKHAVRGAPVRDPPGSRDADVRRQQSANTVHARTQARSEPTKDDICRQQSAKTVYARAPTRAERPKDDIRPQQWANTATHGAEVRARRVEAIRNRLPPGSYYGAGAAATTSAAHNKDDRRGRQPAIAATTYQLPWPVPFAAGVPSLARDWHALAHGPPMSVAEAIAIGEKEKRARVDRSRSANGKTVPSLPSLPAHPNNSQAYEHATGTSNKQRTTLVPPAPVRTMPAVPHGVPVRASDRSHRSASPASRWSAVVVAPPAMGLPNTVSFSVLPGASQHASAASSSRAPTTALTPSERDLVRRQRQRGSKAKAVGDQVVQRARINDSFTEVRLSFYLDRKILGEKGETLHEERIPVHPAKAGPIRPHRSGYSYWKENHPEQYEEALQAHKAARRAARRAARQAARRRIASASTPAPVAAPALGFPAVPPAPTTPFPAAPESTASTPTHLVDIGENEAVNSTSASGPSKVSTPRSLRVIAEDIADKFIFLEGTARTTESPHFELPQSLQPLPKTADTKDRLIRAVKRLTVLTRAHAHANDLVDRTGRYLEAMYLPATVRDDLRGKRDIYRLEVEGIGEKLAEQAREVCELQASLSEKRKWFHPWTVKSLTSKGEKEGSSVPQAFVTGIAGAPWGQCGGPLTFISTTGHLSIKARSYGERLVTTEVNIDGQWRAATYVSERESWELERV